MKTIKILAALLTTVLLLACMPAQLQELYVFTEPASNMPSKSVSVKLSAKWLSFNGSNRFGQRYTPELMFGVNKSWMIHTTATLSDMYSPNLRWESARIYAKNRFLSIDGVHQHFRMAVFGELAYSRNDLMYDELSIDGDQSGGQAGLIVTGLVHRLAVSSTLSYVGVTSSRIKFSSAEFPRQAFNYTLSAGLLALPIKYKTFGQTNLNIYGELLGQRSLDMKRSYADFAPAIQVIFNSNLKFNLGYRFQVAGDMQRMAGNSWLLSVERTFLGAFRQK